MKKIILLIVINVSWSIAFSQIAPVDTTVKILNVQEEKSPSQPAESKFSNVIRWNVIELGRGIFSLGYERRISNYLGIDIQIGYTFRDYGGEMYLETLDLDGDETPVSSFSSINSYKINGALAYLVGLRIYPFGKGSLEGFYVEPHYYKRKWNYVRTIENEYYNPDYFADEPELYEKLSYDYNPVEEDIGIRCGWQFGGGSSRFYVNPYVGLALRSRSKHEIYQIYDGGPYVDDNGAYSYRYKGVVEKKTVPGISLGFNFGVAF